MNHMPIGNSPTIEAVADQVAELMAAAVDKQTSIHLPVDIVVSASPDTTDAEVTTVGVEEGIPEGKFFGIVFSTINMSLGSCTKDFF